MEKRDYAGQGSVQSEKSQTVPRKLARGPFLAVASFGEGYRFDPRQDLRGSTTR